MFKNLPVGKHTFQLWHERAGYLSNVKIGSLTADKKGRLTVTINSGTNALMESRLSPQLFEREK